MWLLGRLPSELPEKDTSTEESEGQPPTDVDISPPLIRTKITKAEWLGEIPDQKWMNFYVKVLTKFVNRYRMKLSLNLEISSIVGISQQKIDEVQAALRELGLDDEIEVDSK